jgi:hypothetical protein
LQGDGPSWDGTSIIRVVLGLAPSSQQSTLNASNPFLEAASQKLLKDNKLGLHLEEPSELNTGSVSPGLFCGNFTYVPWTKEAEDGVLSGSWKTSVISLAIGLSDEVSFDLSGYMAVFTIMWPHMYIPDEIAMTLC